MTKCNYKGCKLSLVESSILCKCKGVFCSKHNTQYIIIVNIIIIMRITKN